MALATATVWEIRSDATAGNVNGGGFVTGASGTDYSQQAAAQWNLTSCTTSGVTDTILHSSAAADMIGNICYVASGTNFTVARYQIIAVSVGVSIQVDRNVATGVGSNGAVNIGGALSLGSSDDAVFEAMEPGNICYIKSGTYTTGGAISIAKAGTPANPIKVIGYATARGDNPIGSTRPILSQGTSAIVFGSFWEVSNLQFTGSAGTVLLTIGASGRISYCKITQTTTTTTRIALSLTNGAEAFGCEIIAYRCNGISGAGGSIIGCYIHDCRVGLLDNGADTTIVLNNIFAACYNYAYHSSGEITSVYNISGNTFVGLPSKLGKGLYLESAGVNNHNRGTIANNIFYGFTEAIQNGASVRSTRIDYNNFYNNTTDVTNTSKGIGNIALDPGFTSIAEVSGSSATTNGSVLSSPGTDFSSVVASRDYLYLVSGSGVTPGVYGISSITGTDVTLDIAPGTNATGDKVFRILTGRNFAVGTNMKAAGYPGTFSSSISIGYLDIGAVQRVEPTAATYSDPGSTNVKTGVSYIYNDVTTTGSYTGADRWSDPGAGSVRLGTEYLANAVTITGTCAVPAAADVKIGVSVDSTTGSYTGADRWSDPGAANVLQGTNYLVNAVTTSGTYVGPSPSSGTAGTVHIGQLKENIRYVLNQANTTTASPCDLSGSMSRRVQTIMTLNPEKIRPQASLFPLVTVFCTGKKIEQKTIAANQQYGKRRAEITFSIVGIVWNDRTTDYRTDAADNDLEYLMENLELILRSHGDLTQQCNWQFPNGVTYHSAGYDENSHFRIGVLDLQASVFY